MLISNASSEVFDGKFDQVRSGDEPVPSHVKGAVSTVPKLLVKENVPAGEAFTSPPPPPLQAINDEMKITAMHAFFNFLNFITRHFIRLS